MFFLLGLQVLANDHFADFQLVLVGNQNNQQGIEDS